MRKLNSITLGNITNQLNQRLSSRSIASQYGVSKSAVNNIRANLSEETPKPKAGAPTKLTTREKREVVNIIVQKRAKTAVEAAKIIRESFSKDVSSQTIRRILKEAGLVAKKKIKKPNLTLKQKKARLRFALSHIEWTQDDWKRVIWSDESKINRLLSDGIKYSWVPSKSDDISARIEPTVKFGGGNIMIWGCITYAGVGRISKIDGRMDAEQYTQILESNLIPTLDACSLLPDFPARDGIYFQQDNDPKHTSRRAKAWFESNKLTPIAWPSNSPDLNPIEHIWDQLKTALGKINPPPKGVHEMWERCEAEWNKISVEACKNLIDSMPRRMAAVIKAKGGNRRSG